MSNPLCGDLTRSGDPDGPLFAMFNGDLFIIEMAAVPDGPGPTLSLSAAASRAGELLGPRLGLLLLRLGEYVGCSINP